MHNTVLKKLRHLFSNYKKDKKISPSLTAEECNKKIGEALCNKQPYFAGRLGWMEGYTIGKLLAEGTTPCELREKLALHAGVFPPTEEQLKKFAAVYLEGMSSVDIFGLMGAPFHGWLIKKYAPQAARAELSSLEPYFYEAPWSWQMQGLTVLVVHPFAESIMRQYSMLREQLFINPKTLPEFTLKVIKAPQTITGNATEYDSWLDTLGALEKKVQQEKFDVAIVGCGAYGFPLAATIKKMGKVAIHLGGATQLLFGVSGNRWRNHPQFKTIITDAWRPPLESERPAGWEKIESGCYW